MYFEFLSADDKKAIDALKQYHGGAKKISETITEMRKYETRKRILNDKGFGDMIADAEELVKKFPKVQDYEKKHNISYDNSLGVGTAQVSGWQGAKVTHNAMKRIAESAEKLVKGNHDTHFPALGNHDEIGEVARALNILKEILLETTQLQQQLQTTRLTLSKTEKNLSDVQTENKNIEDSAATALSVARHETQSVQLELEQEKGNVTEANQALEQEKNKAQKAQRELEQELEREKKKQVAQTPPKPAEQPAPTRRAPTQDSNGAPIESIAALSDQLAESSQTASSAAFEAERTSTLIRGLNDAETQLDRIEPL
ncbi:MAG: HAMP domain-containing protein, partial [Candidatus Cloacimonetes bacterium]|nr:HAMP domain-containing protein [Candidatus Cloacimonadota bacterium]